MKRTARLAIVAAVLVAILAAGCASAANRREAPQKETPAPPAAVSPERVNAEDGLASGLQRLADQIVASLNAQQASRIAVVQFQDLDGSVSELGAFIAEEMTTRLYQAGTFRVVEREMLNRVMAEHELTATGLVDESTARELGKLLGVEAIAVGTLTDFGSEVRVNSRLIETNTGSVFAAAAITLLKDVRLEKLMAHYLKRTATTHAPGAEPQVRRETEQAEPSSKPGLVGEYYNLAPNSNDLPSGEALFRRIDPTINCNFGTGGPVPRIAADRFGIRWSGYIAIEQAGAYTLSFKHDDGLRVWIGDRKVYDRWVWTEDRWAQVDVTFSEIGWLPFRAEFMDTGAGAHCAFRWALPGRADFEDVTAQRFRHDQAQ